MPTGALGSYGLAGWGMGVGMGAMDSLPTSYLLVAVSLDGKVMGVRFTEALGWRRPKCTTYRGQCECARYHAHASRCHDCRCYESAAANFRAGAGKLSLLMT